MRADQVFEGDKGQLFDADPDDLDPQRPDRVVSFGITLGGTIISMRRPVDLNAEEQGGAVEVEHEDRNGLLPAELESKAAPAT